MTARVVRALRVSEELVRAYSRRGNYHSDPSLSAGLNLPGLVAQGAQAAGPAYAALLDTWGEEFLTHGEVDLRFVGLVLAGDTVEATVAIDDDGTASFEVVNTTGGRTAVAGTARRDSTR